MIQLRDNQRCYVCGRENPAGLKVDFEINTDTKTIRARFQTLPGHQGYDGVVHGGILSALLDEAMAKLAFTLGLPAVTAEITVKFLSPVTPGEVLFVFARITRDARRLVEAEATIERGTTIVASAAAKLLRG